MTYRKLLSLIAESFEATGIPEPDQDAWRLFEGIWGMSRAEFFIRAEEEARPAENIEKLNEYAELRKKRIPIQYITGVQNFLGYDFMVSKDTLIPRFDTEILAERAAIFCRGKKVLDMCTGTGCILLAASKIGLPEKAVGCDISKGACETARLNAERLNVKADIFEGDLFDALTGTEYENVLFDIIVSNPPYIKSADIEELMPEVKDFEPRAALDGMEDGLWFYERITKEAVSHIAPGGVLMYEIGCGQADDVKKIMELNGFTHIDVIKDYAGLDRVVTGIRKAR